MSTALETQDRATSTSFGGTIVETAGTKGAVLVLYLVAITTVAAMSGVSALEGVIPGALLVALLAVGTLFEVSALRRPIDHVGVLIMGIALAYTGLEYLAVRQGVLFPTAAAGVLLASVVVDAVRHRSGAGFDVVELLGNIDIVGLYGAVLLLVYALLYQGDQLAFIYTPYFPAFALAFAISLLITSVAYISRTAAAQEEPGQLHQRLVSVIGSLVDVEDDEEKREIAQHVRAVAGALNGVEVPSRIEDDEGRVPLVLPVSHTQIAFRSSALDEALDGASETELTGFLVDADRNVIFLRRGEPVKYYVASTERYDDDMAALAESGAFDGDVRGYHADRPFVDDVLDVTPEPSAGVDLLAETEEEIERRLEEPADDGEPGEAGAPPAGEGASLDEGERKQPKEERYDITDIENVEGAEDEEDQEAPGEPSFEVGGRDLDLEEMLDRANKVFDEDSPY